jgi:hypothetical protein
MAVINSCVSVDITVLSVSIAMLTFAKKITCRLLLCLFYEVIS